MASPVCTRNSCGWSYLYEKFSNHGYTAIQRVIFRTALCQGIKILNNAQSNFLPSSSGSNFDTDVIGTQDVKFSVITPKTL